MKTEKMYGLAIREKTNPNDFFWETNDYLFEECKIECNGRYWLADPFLFERNGITYIFFEALDLITKVGKIGYSIRNYDGSFTKPRIVIDEPYHLSFPNIFEYGGDVFIMPERCEDWRVKLFKAKSFPDEWVVADCLLPDVYACDSIFLERDDKRWLLTNEMYHNAPVDNYSSCWVKNYLYEMNGLQVIGGALKIAEGDQGVRNAGKSFRSEGKDYRIGQDCRYRQYGRGLSLFEIKSVQPYKEKMLWSKDCQEIAPHISQPVNREIIGVHTYNSSEHWEIIDFSQIRPLPLRVQFLRAILPITRRIKRLMSK